MQKAKPSISASCRLKQFHYFPLADGISKNRNRQLLKIFNQSDEYVAIRKNRLSPEYLDKEHAEDSTFNVGGLNVIRSKTQWYTKKTKYTGAITQST